MTSSGNSLTLPVLLLAAVCIASLASLCTGHERPASGSSNNLNVKATRQHPSLTSLLRRRRSMKGGLWGPPPYNSYLANSLSQASPSSTKDKRGQDDEWIWMPAYGYVPMPRDNEDADAQDEDHRIGNLLRYG